MRRGWIFGAVMLALAAPALPAECTDVPGTAPGPDKPVIDQRRQAVERLAAQRRHLRQVLDRLQGMTLTLKKAQVQARPAVAGRELIEIVDGTGHTGPLVVPVQGTASAGSLPAPGGGERSSAPAPEAAGDVYVFSPHNAFPTGTRRLGIQPAPNGPTDYYALRFFPSQLAKELPFQVDGIYWQQDDLVSWSPSWRLSVVTESIATPFVPDLGAVVAPAVVFSTGTLFPRSANGGINALENAYVDFPSDPQYPSAAQFAVEDGAMSDQFNRAAEPLVASVNWWECVSTECFTTTTLNVAGNGVVKSGAGTALGWRLPDFGVGDCDMDPVSSVPCWRYLHDYIDDSRLLFFVPDSDVRLSLDYDLSSGSAAGVFARASLDVNQPTLPLFDYYLIWVQKGVGAVPNTLNIASSDGTALVPPQNLAAGSAIGALTVDISGSSTVTIRAQVGANPALVATDSTRRFQGDVTLGNIYGIAFPNASGGERVDNFRSRRHADLFAVIQFPPPPPGATCPAGTFGAGCLRIWADGQEEGREFFNTFISENGTGWSQTGVGAGGDCLKWRNTLVALRVKDATPAVDDELFQVNGTLETFYLPCCTCTMADAFDCSGLSLDDYCLYCASPPPVAGDCTSLSRPDVRPLYAPNLPIDIIPLFNNDRAPTLPAGVTAGTMWFVYVAHDLSIPPPDSDIVAVDGILFDLGRNLCDPANPNVQMGEIPGLNDSTQSTYPCIFGPTPRPVGPLFLQVPGSLSFTPTQATDYRIDMLEFYDLNGDCCADGAEGLTARGPGCPATCTPVANPDEYLPNNSVSRIISVAQCTQGTNSIRKNTLAITKDAACPANALLAFWVGNDLSAGYNLHEIVGVANKSTIANPFANTPLLPDIRLPDECFVPSLAGTAGVAYYGCFWRNNCSGASEADP